MRLDIVQSGDYSPRAAMRGAVLWVPESSPSIGVGRCRHTSAGALLAALAATGLVARAAALAHGTSASASTLHVGDGPSRIFTTCAQHTTPWHGRGVTDKTAGYFSQLCRAPSPLCR